jgi:Group II intron, maturase-specific domain
MTIDIQPAVVQLREAPSMFMPKRLEALALERHRAVAAHMVPYELTGKTVLLVVDPHTETVLRVVDALKRMRQTVRGWRIHRQTSTVLDDLAQQCNPTIQGWWNYYGAFYQIAMRKFFRYVDRKLEQWARRKYKTLSSSARNWSRKVRCQRSSSC